VARRDGRKNTKPRPLSRRRILEAALELVDREGAEALTMRRLGGELGVAAMSLYNHVRGREDVLDGLSELMVSRIPVEGGDASPPAVLERFMCGIRSVALVHPAAFELVGMRPLRTADAFEPVEAVLAALREIGLGDEDAAHAYRLLVAYARGFALAEIAGLTFEEAGEAPTGMRPAELDAERFPQIVALAPRLERPDRDAAFAFGASVLLAGLAALQSPRPQARVSARS
jgi:AcrR family transcriptional regulator